MNRLVSALSGASLIAAVVTTPTIGEDPRPIDLKVVESKDSGTLQRASAEMRAVIEKLIALGAKPVNTLTVDQARHQATPADAVKAVVAENTGQPAVPEMVGRTKDTKITGAAGELDARVYWPVGSTDGSGSMPVVLYFHGGGWVIANLDVYDASPRALANLANAVVVSVHYRQGPESKFPAAHDDAVAAYKYVVKHAADWNGDSERLAVVGESAGGGLALHVAIAARDQKLNMPEAVVAVYPIAGKDTETASYLENRNAVPLNKAGMEWFFANYLNTMNDASDPRVDLVHADLKDLPPVTIVAAEIDPLRSDGELLRDKLEAAGNDVTYQNWNGVTHEFFGMAAVVPQAKEAQDLVGSELRQAFGE